MTSKHRETRSLNPSEDDRITPEALTATRVEAAKRAHMDEHDGNPYVWRRYKGPPDPYWITSSTFFRPAVTIGQLHPLDELVSLADGHRVAYLIDFWPHRWPDLIAAGEAARGTVPA